VAAREAAKMTFLICMLGISDVEDVAACNIDRS
jgi:hypothetical protein